MPNFFSRLRRWLLPFRARASIERQHAEPENTSVEVISAHSPAASSEHRRLHSQNNMKLQEDIPAQPAVVAMSDADLAKYSPGYSSPSPAYGGYSPIGGYDYNSGASDWPLGAIHAATMAGNTSIVKPKPSIKLVGTQAN